ncbi:hypothetical protein GCM10011351_19710 [Paraliobacillus quinghaiensis]|uniref:Uncharacterized protein n=1 Tax=Paraliobacillus quinghaiensis TaxID=470815 RepID=A0A917WUL4_9BACI|nr:hypothetical protein GCM10011351_19710 [Paraliobacillus quinghaiensis]
MTLLWEQLMFSMGRVIAVPQVEDPLGEVFFFTKLAETEPTESESIWGCDYSPHQNHC